jgi:hypothetical protein
MRGSGVAFVRRRAEPSLCVPLVPSAPPAPAVGAKIRSNGLVFVIGVAEVVHLRAIYPDRIANRGVLAGLLTCGFRH